MKLGSENGPVLWTRGWQSKGPVDMVEMGAHLFVLGWNAELQRVDAATGLDDGKSLDVLWPGDTKPGCDDAVSSYGIKLGADGTHIIVAYREHGVVRWLEPTTGAVVREVAVPQPRAVVVGDAGAVFVLSGAELVSVAADGAISKILGAGVLAAPVTFDFDRTRREFFVVEGGADQRVRRFALDGKSLGNFGRLGGRADGAYVAADFRDVSHLHCDGAGGFYAVESDHLRRIVHVAVDGSVTKEWLGGSPFFSVTSVDAAAPGELWYSASFTTMAVVALDVESGKWRITHTYSMPVNGFGDGLFPAVGDFPVWRVRRHASGTVLIHESPAALLRVDAAAGKLVPVALASHKRWDARAFKNAAINAAMEKAGLAYDDVGSDAFTWSDSNGNGALDAEEFRFHKSVPLMHGRYCAFDEQLNVYVGFSGAQNHTYTGKRWMIFDFKGAAYAKLPNLAAAGAATPVWDWGKLELSRAMLPDDLRSTEVGAVAARWDARGGVTLAVRGEIGERKDRHGLVWPEDTVGTSALLRALPDGTAWTVSKQKSPGMPAAAVMSHPGYFPGVAHGCIIACNRNNYGAVAWTEDGLFAGFFLDRHKNDLPDWAYEPAVRVSAEKSAVHFILVAKQPKPLTVRFRQTGTDAVTTAGQVTIPAAALTARAAVSVENGPRKIELEPSAEYRGDGTASAVKVGSIPSVTDGLAAAYLLDEAQGRTLHDSVGDAHAPFDGFMNPPVPRWQPTGGIRGGAIEFPEPGIRVNLPGAKIAGDFTVAFWLRTQQATQPVMQGTFDLWLADGQPRIDFGGWGTSASKGPRLDDGQWHHLAFVWDESGGQRAMHLFLDGTPAAAGTGPANGSTDKLSLGVSNHLQGHPFIGTFDEIRIYRRSLTPHELAELAQPNAHPSAPTK